MQNNEVNVSVIIPTYNRPVMLKRAVDSVVNQTYKNVEIIVVDDNSDNTPARFETENLMAQYRNESTITYIKHATNRNGAAARNTGIKVAKGDFVSFLDDDDYYLPDKIARQYSFLMQNPDCMGVYCARIQNGKTVPATLSGDLTREMMCMSFTPTTPSLMFRKVAVVELNGFDETYQRHQDYEFLLRYFKKYPIAVINDVLVVIGDNKGGNALTGISLEGLKNKFLLQFKETIYGLECKGVVRKNEIQARHYSTVFWSHLRTGNFRLAVRLYLIYLYKAPVIFNANIAKYFVAYVRHKAVNWSRQ
mgnify:CR=1 FL=1